MWVGTERAIRYTTNLGNTNEIIDILPPVTTRKARPLEAVTGAEHP